jgi:hypothetical protein
MRLYFHPVVDQVSEAHHIQSVVLLESIHVSRPPFAIRLGASPGIPRTHRPLYPARRHRRAAKKKQRPASYWFGTAVASISFHSFMFALQSFPFKAHYSALHRKRLPAASDIPFQVIISISIAQCSLGPGYASMRIGQERLVALTVS